MNGKLSSPHVIYWTVLAMILAGAIAIGMWKRMSDADKNKMLLGLR